jgi:hypothetical protein
MNKKLYFETTTEKLHTLLKIYDDVIVRQDNRLKNSIAMIHHYTYVDTKEDCYLLRYNSNGIKSCPKWQLVRIIFHELAHLVLGHCKNTFIDDIDKEYRAEKLAILWIKRYYPNYYKRSIEHLKRYKNYNIQIYREAFTKLWRELHETNINR